MTVIFALVITESELADGREDGEPVSYTHLHEKFDVVAANIVADVIIMFCPQVKNYMKPGASFVTSGIIDTREQDVLHAFAANGLQVRSRKESGGWLSFVCTTD